MLYRCLFNSVFLYIWVLYVVDVLVSLGLGGLLAFWEV